MLDILLVAEILLIRMSMFLSLGFLKKTPGPGSYESMSTVFQLCTHTCHQKWIQVWHVLKAQFIVLVTLKNPPIRISVPYLAVFLTYYTYTHKRKWKWNSILDKLIAAFIQWIIIAVTSSAGLCLHKLKNTVAHYLPFPLSQLHVQLPCLKAISVMQLTECKLAIHIIPKLLWWLSSSHSSFIWNKEVTVTQ